MSIFDLCLQSSRNQKLENRPVNAENSYPSNSSTENERVVCGFLDHVHGAVYLEKQVRSGALQVRQRAGRIECLERVVWLEGERKSRMRKTPRDPGWIYIGSDIFISLFPWPFMAAVAPWTTITPTLNRLCEGTWLPDDPSCSRDNLKGTHGFAQAVRTHLFINAISPYFCFIDLKMMFLAAKSWMIKIDLSRKNGNDFINFKLIV